MSKPKGSSLLTAATWNSAGSFHYSVASLVIATLLLAAAGASHADIIYVSNQINSYIEKFDSVTGHDFGIFASGLNGPMGLALDTGGNLYVANAFNNTIVRFTPGGLGSVFANTGLVNPRGLVFDTAGNLYAANFDGGTIEKFTPSGVGSVFAHITTPTGLAFDSGGNLYAANETANTIMKFTPGGVGSVFANTGLSYPFGLAFDRAGNLYAANFALASANKSIEKFTPDGVASTFATGFFGPCGLAFDSTGNLYMANFDINTIEYFTPNGVGSVFASTGLNEPRFIAIQPIPEPSAVVLYAVGLTMMLRFRRRT